MYLVSLAEQIVQVAGRAFAFAEGERIHTENSHKYTVAEFQPLASASGWRPVKAWTDPDHCSACICCGSNIGAAPLDLARYAGHAERAVQARHDPNCRAKPRPHRC